MIFIGLDERSAAQDQQGGARKSYVIFHLNFICEPALY